MEKFPEARQLLAEGAGQLDVLPVLPAPLWQLERVHKRAYLDAIAEGTLTRYERNRLGLPHHPRLLERSAMETAGTVQAALAALEDGLAANLAGGTHHAFAERGLGFCVLNDIAVAVAELRSTRPELHIMVIDTDAHQGNGTHHLLRGDPFAYTYSIHVGRNYPAQKEPGDCDVPLPRWVQGREYRHQLQATLPEAFHRAEPDLVFWIAGADLHVDDRFGQMQLSDEDIMARDYFVLDLVTRWQVPLAVLYGGGYNRQAGKTAALHAATVYRTAEFALHPRSLSG